MLLLCGAVCALAGAGGDDEVCGAGEASSACTAEPGEGHVGAQSLLQAGTAATRVSVGDLHLRFQKYNDTYTLPAINYPLDKAQTEKDLAGTTAVSPRWFGHRQVTFSLPEGMGGSDASMDPFTSVQTNLLQNNVRYLATHPDDADPTQFWDEFEEVVAAQQMRRNNELTQSIMTMHPLFAQEEDIDASAQRVKADFPTDFPILQIKRFLGQGLKLDDNIFRRGDCGQSGTPEFVNAAVALSGIAGWAITQVSPVAFASKWHVGRLRPEEVAMMVNQDRFSGQAGSQIKRAISGMRLSHAAEFTAYTEGSPVHPSWPAMHSAASSLSTWMDVVADLTPAQREEARLLDYSIAYFRTLAGVHYESDNRAGLAMGKGIIERKLPEFLADMYACDDASASAINDYVVNKIKSVDLDWSTWTPPKWVKPTLQQGRR